MHATNDHDDIQMKEKGKAKEMKKECMNLTLNRIKVMKLQEK